MQCRCRQERCDCLQAHGSPNVGNPVLDSASPSAQQLPAAGCYGYKSYYAQHPFPIPVAMPYAPTPGPFAPPPKYVPGLGYLEPCWYDIQGCRRADCCYYHPAEFRLSCFSARTKETDRIQDINWEVFWSHVIQHLEEGVGIIRQLFLAELLRRNQTSSEEILGNPKIMEEIWWESELAYRVLFQREFPSRVQRKGIPHDLLPSSKKARIICWNHSFHNFQVETEDQNYYPRNMYVRPSLLVAFRDQHAEPSDVVHDPKWLFKVRTPTGMGDDFLICRSMVDQVMTTPCDFWRVVPTVEETSSKGEPPVPTKEKVAKCDNSNQTVEEIESREDAKLTSKTREVALNFRNTVMATETKASTSQQSHRKPALVSTETAQKKNLNKPSETDQSRSMKAAFPSSELYASKWRGGKVNKGIKSAEQKQQNGSDFSSNPNVDENRASLGRNQDLDEPLSRKLPVNREVYLNQSTRNPDKDSCEKSEHHESDTRDERIDTQDMSLTKKERKKKKKKDKLKKKKESQEGEVFTLKSETGVGKQRSNSDETFYDKTKKDGVVSEDKDVSSADIGLDGSSSTFKTTSPELEPDTNNPTESIKLELNCTAASTDESLAQTDWNPLTDEAVTSGGNSKHLKDQGPANSETKTKEYKKDYFEDSLGRRRRKDSQRKKGQHSGSPRLDDETTRSTRRNKQEAKSFRKESSKQPVHPQGCKCPQCQVSQANAVVTQQEAVQREAYRQLLGVEDTATSSEIRQAHRRLALQYHPDKFREGRHEMTKAQAEVHFQQIQEAYQCLTAFAQDKEV